MSEQRFVSFDGAEIFYRAWLPEGKVTRALLLFHRGHEHSGRWQETVEGLGMEGCAVFAWDQRGHGKSPGKRGHAPSFGALVKDADRFARHVREQCGVAWEETAVVASSVGAVVAAAWVHDYAPEIRALVLAAPAFRVKLYVPLAVLALRARERVLPGGEVKSYVKSRMLTHDAGQAAAYEADPLIFRQISVKLLLELHDAGKRLVTDAAAIGCPTLVLSAGKDWVVDLAAQRKFFARLGSGVKQMEMYPELNHALFHERGRVVERIRTFLEECFARKPLNGAIGDADKGGVTRTEYDLLRGPSSLRWRATQMQMKTFGRLSAGIRLGWQTGFDSGKSLDYVYENRSRGITPLGKVIDHFYLQSIG